MRLRPVTSDDLELYRRLYCDPVVMAELGGPLPEDGLRAKLARDAEATIADRYWMLALVPQEDGEAAGTVCIWTHDQDGESIDEIGWMVLPEYQGQGLGSAAVSLVLDKARAEARWRVVHAYPGVTNAASNAICGKLGFTQLAARDIEYQGRTIRCNHWIVDLGGRR